VLATTSERRAAGVEFDLAVVGEDFSGIMGASSQSGGAR
jgi:hypothetical protein